jgi:hypothetical protein
LSERPSESAGDPGETSPADGATLSVSRILARMRPYPFEIAAWVCLITGVGFLRSQGLRIDWRTFDYTVPPLLPVMAKYAVVGIGMLCVFTLVSRKPLRDYLKEIATVRWLVLSLRLWVAIIIFNYTYFWSRCAAQRSAGSMPGTGSGWPRCR